jgi:uncharacterized protein (TIGR02678 family)
VRPLARIAAHLDPAAELDDFQAAARLLVTHPLVTDRYPQPGALALIRRFQEPLRGEFVRLCHWRLDVAPTCARLVRRPVALSQHRSAHTATTTRRAFTPRTYAYLCLVLAGLESLGDQTTLTDLADETLRLGAGDEALVLDLTQHAHRRAFVDAVTWLERRGVLTQIDGNTEGFVSAGEDALYDVNTDAVGRLLVSPPSVLSGIIDVEEFLQEVYPPTPEGDLARTRHQVHRRLLTETALYYVELPAAEREYARQRRTRIRDELERLTGCTLECRAEGQALIGMPTAEAFPAGGVVAQAGLLFGGELVSDLGPPHGDEVGGSGRKVSAGEATAAWERVVVAYGSRFTADYRADPTRLRVDATALLRRLDLVAPLADGGLVVRPALARYRPDVSLPLALDV